MKRDFGELYWSVIDGTGYWILGISIVLKVILRNSPTVDRETLPPTRTSHKKIFLITWPEREECEARGYINFHPFGKQLKIILHSESFAFCVQQQQPLKMVADGKCKILMNFGQEILSNFLTLSFICE